jgi:hypothetical protein
MMYSGMQKRFALLAALALAFGLSNSGRVADAGLISSGLESVSSSGALVESFDLSPGTSSGAEDSNSTGDKGGQKTEVDAQSPALGVVNLGPANGMAPPAPETSGSQHISALPTDGTVTFQQMSVWLGAEGRAALAPPISTRIFRPPRFVG